ncbi:MAG: mechanosensitive ion channel [Sedimentisphaerales bacterium]|nr:mechanosensitive ion channel [Sedimentisphaerales bacterium]
MIDFINTIYEHFKQFVADYWLKIVGALIILVIGWWLAKMISRLIAKAMTKAKVDPTLTSFTRHLVEIVILVFVVLAALQKLSVPVSNFAVIVGAAGLAIGFALQGSLSNFAAGIMLIIFKPFKVGDFIEAAGKMGTVKEIQIFNTILNSPDNVRIIIPNGQVTGTNIMNFTVNGTRRIDLVVGVSYGDDLKKAHKVIEEVIKSEDRILPEPAYTIAVSELGDSSVNFVVRPWVNATDYWSVRFNLIEKIKLALDKNGITIPFPQRDIHMKSEVA